MWYSNYDHVLDFIFTHFLILTEIQNVINILALQIGLKTSFTRLVVAKRFIIISKILAENTLSWIKWEDYRPMGKNIFYIVVTPQVFN
jgi:hypothetical protein